MKNITITGVLIRNRLEVIADPETHKAKMRNGSRSGDDQDLDRLIQDVVK
jgi:hypothetical protein